MSRPKPEHNDFAALEPHALDRHARSIPSFDARWLWGAAVVAPLALSAGVYMLHLAPGGSTHASGPAILEVRLIEQAPEPKRDPPTAPQVSTGYVEPLVDAPDRPIPEETTAPVSAPAAVAALPPSATETARAAPASRVSSGAKAASSNFQNRLFSHIARYRRYPSAARTGQHGTVKLVFSLRRDGMISDLRVHSSSGYPVLDEAATETIRRAQPLPAIPPDLPEKLTILFPIEFDEPR